MSGWICLECGKRFKTVAAAERAANNGCPNCGGVDVDLDPDADPLADLRRENARRKAARAEKGGEQ